MAFPGELATSVQRDFSYLTLHIPLHFLLHSSLCGAFDDAALVTKHAQIVKWRVQHRNHFIQLCDSKTDNTHMSLPRLKTTDNQEVLKFCISILALAHTPKRLHGKRLQQAVVHAAW